MDQYSRWPKISLPTLTMVEPAAMAMWRSSLMPIEHTAKRLSPTKGPAARRSKVSRIAAKSAATRPRSSGVFDAMYGHMGERRGHTHCQIISLIGGETKLGLLGCHMELEQDVDMLLLTDSLGLNRHEQPLGVDALYHVGAAHHAAHLVGLEMAYEVPHYVVGQHGGFFGELGSAALAKTSLADVVGLHQR